MSETLIIDLDIAARPETVFGLFTDPAEFGRWMGGGHGSATLAPEVGGALRVTFPGSPAVVSGEVVEIDPPRRFAFTWGYESGTPFPAGSTRVTIELSPSETGTHLRLTHSGLPDEDAVRRHRGGFRVYTSVLAANASRAEFGLRLPSLAADWCAAWAERDAAARGRLLAACTTDDVEFRHAYAATLGRRDLSDHIAISQASTPGIRLVPGTPDLCHQFVRMPWTAMAGELAVATGENVCLLAQDGRFRQVAGFSDPAPG